MYYPMLSSVTKGTVVTTVNKQCRVCVSRCLDCFRTSIVVADVYTILMKWRVRAVCTSIMYLVVSVFLCVAVNIVACHLILQMVICYIGGVVF